MHAVDCYKSGNFDESRLLFLELGDYLNSNEFIKSCDYKDAIELLENQDYEEALLILSELNYSDSEEKAVLCKYSIGKAAFDEKDYETAIEYLGDIDYEDSQKLASECTRQIGMSENADFAFLNSLEESVLYRMKHSNEDSNYSLSTLVETELAYLGKYSSESFYDKDLKSLATKYINGVKKQKEALNYQYADQQLKWQEGRVARLQALKDLNQRYDFLSGNAEFEANYLRALDEAKVNLDGIKAVEKDLQYQFDTYYIFDYSDYYDNIYGTIANNTEYEYGIIFHFTLYDSYGSVISDSYIDYVERVLPYSTFEISFYPPNNLDSFSYETEFLTLPH